MSDAQDGGVSAAPDAPAQEEPEKRTPQVSVERVGPCECVIRIEADADLLRERYQKELHNLQTQVKLPGFRRGKAPVGLVERRMGSSVRSDLLATIVSEGYDKALEEHELTVVADKESPDLENYAWEPGQPADFTFTCEVMPEVRIEGKDYKGLRVEVPVLEVNDELLRQEKDRFALQFATWEQVTGAGIDWDDYVEAEVSAEGVEFEETIGFYPRAERIGPFSVEGVKAALVGAKVGDQVQVEGKVLEKETSGREALEPLAGQAVKLNLALKQVARRKVPTLDDELARKIGLSSAGEIDSMVRERLQEALARRKDEIARQMAVEGLLRNVDCPMPPALVEKAAEDHQLRALVRMLRTGVPRQDAERIAAEQTGRSMAAVEQRLKATFLLRKVAEAERIVVTESEVDSQIRAFAGRQGWREERARSYMDERGMTRALRDDMRESKTIGLLLENGEVREMPPDEFARRHGAEQVQDLAGQGEE
jgi:trigger factor